MSERSANGEHDSGDTPITSWRGVEKVLGRMDTRIGKQGEKIDAIAHAVQHYEQREMDRHQDFQDLMRSNGDLRAAVLARPVAPHPGWVKTIAVAAVAVAIRVWMR
jgi:hypothetical protein